MKICIYMLLLCFLTSACSTVPYNPRREIKVEQTWYGTTYKQGSNKVNPSDISKKLAQKPELKSKMKTFEARYRIHQATGLLGGFILIGSLFSGNSNGSTILLSAALLGTSYYYDRLANEVLAPEVKNRNAYVYNYDVLKNYQVKKNHDLKIMVPVYSYRF